MLSFFRRQWNRVPAQHRWTLRVAGWTLAGLAAGWIVSLILPVAYTSEATLHPVPAAVSQDLLPHDAMDVPSLLNREKPIVLSRNVLTTIVNNFNLYPSARKREPMEDVIEDFRKDVRIEVSGAALVRVVFTYPDRLLANKVTQDLVGRIIAETLSEKSNTAAETAQFFQDQADKVGKSWLKASADVKAMPATDPRYELLVLNRDQKRKEYESVAQKLGAVEMLHDLEQRGQGSRLELLDAATLPQEPDTAPSIFQLAGFGCGLAVGLLIELRRSLRRTLPSFAAPGVEPA